MLTIWGMAHVFPAIVTIYGGLRALFGHKFAVQGTLAVAGLVILGYWLMPSMVKAEQVKQLDDRRKEQTRDRICANLELVKSRPRFGKSNDSSISKLALDQIQKVPQVAFKEHKRVYYVNTDDKLDHFVAVLSFSKPRWVGVDLEHSKTNTYYGLVCLIQISWPVLVKDKLINQTFLIDTLSFPKA